MSVRARTAPSSFWPDCPPTVAAYALSTSFVGLRGFISGHCNHRQLYGHEATQGLYTSRMPEPRPTGPEPLFPALCAVGRSGTVVWQGSRGAQGAGYAGRAKLPLLRRSLIPGGPHHPGGRGRQDGERQPPRAVPTLSQHEDGARGSEGKEEEK